MGTVTRYLILLAVLAGALSACAGTRDRARYVDSGFGVTTYGFIQIDASTQGFVYDQRTNRLEYAEGDYAFVSRDSIALSARFDPLAIPYLLYRTSEARSLTHINVSNFALSGSVFNASEPSAIRCPEPGRCRVVLYPSPDLYPRPRHDSLSTELFDVRGDETIVTRVNDIIDWYRIAIRDTVRVTEAVRQREY